MWTALLSCLHTVTPVAPDGSWATVHHRPLLEVLLAAVYSRGIHSLLGFFRLLMPDILSAYGGVVYRLLLEGLQYSIPKSMVTCTGPTYVWPPVLMIGSLLKQNKIFGRPQSPA